MKKTAIVLPLLVLFVYARDAMGYGAYGILNYVFAIMAYYIVDYFLKNRDERQEHVEWLTRKIRQVNSSFIQHLSLFCIFLYFGGTYTIAKEANVAFVQQIVEVVGIFVLMLYPIFKLITTNNIHSSAIMSLLSCIKQIVRGLAIWSVFMWTMGNYGTEVVAWYYAKPEEVLAAVVAISIIWVMMRMTTDSSNAYVNTREHPSRVDYANGIAGMSRAPTVRDRKYIAAHEAGHALLYAALEELPQHVELVIKESSSQDGVMGYVTGINSKHLLDEKGYSEWLMLTYLAGRFGEYYSFAENTLGSMDDHHKWLKLAQRYLSNHFVGIYYSVPSNELEMLVNDQKLEILQKTQIEVLSKLFEMNDEIYKKIIQSALTQKRVERDELMFLLSQVKLPDDFPRPQKN